MSFQNGRNMTVMAGALALGAARMGDWGDAFHGFTGDVDRYPPRWADDPKPEPILRYVAIAKAKKKRAAKQARRQRRNRK